MSDNSKWAAVAVVVLVVLGGIFYSAKSADAASVQGTLNQLYGDWQKTGDVNAYYDMCALAVNSDPSAVPNKVLDACMSGLQ